MARWFNLAPEGRMDMVHRLDGTPLVRLRLAEPASEEVQQLALVAGWIVYDGGADFDHYGQIPSTSEMVNLLKPFFSEERLRHALAAGSQASGLPLHVGDLADAYKAVRGHLGAAVERLEEMGDAATAAEVRRLAEGLSGAAQDAAPDLTSPAVVIGRLLEKEGANSIDDAFGAIADRIRQTQARAAREWRVAEVQEAGFAEATAWLRRAIGAGRPGVSSDELMIDEGAWRAANERYEFRVRQALDVLGADDPRRALNLARTARSLVGAAHGLVVERMELLDNLHEAARAAQRWMTATQLLGAGDLVNRIDRLNEQIGEIEHTARDEQDGFRITMEPVARLHIAAAHLERLALSSAGSYGRRPELLITLAEVSALLEAVSAATPQDDNDRLADQVRAIDEIYDELYFDGGDRLPFGDARTARLISLPGDKLLQIAGRLRDIGDAVREGFSPSWLEDQLLRCAGEVRRAVDLLEHEEISIDAADLHLKIADPLRWAGELLQGWEVFPTAAGLPRGLEHAGVVLREFATSGPDVRYSGRELSDLLEAIERAGEAIGNGEHLVRRGAEPMGAIEGTLDDNIARLAGKLGLGDDARARDRLGVAVARILVPSLDSSADLVRLHVLKALGAGLLRQVAEIDASDSEGYVRIPRGPFGEPRSTANSLLRSALAGVDGGKAVIGRLEELRQEFFTAAPVPAEESALADVEIIDLPRGLAERIGKGLVQLGEMVELPPLRPERRGPAIAEIAAEFARSAASGDVSREAALRAAAEPLFADLAGAGEVGRIDRLISTFRWYGACELDGRQVAELAGALQGFGVDAAGEVADALKEDGFLNRKIISDGRETNLIDAVHARLRSVAASILERERMPALPASPDLGERLQERFGISPKETAGLSEAEQRAAYEYLARAEALEAEGGSIQEIRAEHGHLADDQVEHLVEKQIARLDRLRAQHAGDVAGRVAVEKLEAAAAAAGKLVSAAAEERSQPAIPASLQVSSLPAAPATAVAGLQTMPADLRAKIEAKVATARLATGHSKNSRGGLQAAPFDGGALLLWEKLAEPCGEALATMIVGEGFSRLRSGSAAFSSFEGLAIRVSKGEAEPQSIASLITTPVFDGVRDLEDAVVRLRGLVEPRDIWRRGIEYMAAQLPFTVLDGYLPRPASLSEEIASFVGLERGERRRGVQVIDATMPKALVDETRYRLAAALSFMQEKLGFSGEGGLEEMFAGRAVQVLLQREPSIGGVAAGRHVSQGETSVVNLSPFHSSAAVHELAHALDYVRLDRRGALYGAVADHGLMDSAKRMFSETIGAIHPRFAQERRTEMAKYYLSPVEIFPRVVTQALKAELPAGDLHGAAAGGAFCLPIGFDFEPQKHLCASFLPELREQLARQPDMTPAEEYSAAHPY